MLEIGRGDTRGAVTLRTRAVIQPLHALRRGWSQSQQARGGRALQQRGGES